MGLRLIAEIKKRGIPALYAQETSADPIVYLEISLFAFPWRWFVTECELDPSGCDVLFFGYVMGYENEWGYFRLSELEEARRPLLVDYGFKPVKFSELKKEYDL